MRQTSTLLLLSAITWSLPSFAAGSEHFSECMRALLSTELTSNIPLQQPLWTQGLDRISVVTDAQKSGTILEVRYPKGGLGPKETGAQWVTPFMRKADRITISYDVKFQKGFDFVKGGKLPGIQGGGYDGVPYRSVTGGRIPNGKDGFSARLMWRTNGEVEQYVYHPDMKGLWGEEMRWQTNGQPVHFVPGTWQKVKSEIILNTPGQRNGSIRSWLDGQLVLERTNLRFRDIDAIHIDAFVFSTFFGGNTTDWAAHKDEQVYFDNFLFTSP